VAAIATANSHVRVSIRSCLAAATLATFALAGCTQTETPEGDETPSGAGTITGVVTFVGGPVNQDGKPALDHQPAADWPVRIRSDDGQVIRTTSDGEGHFTFEVEPGTYTLECLRVEKLVVTSNDSVGAQCVVPVP